MDLSHIHEKVLNADVSGVSIITPLRHARRLSKAYIHIMKREDMQSVFHLGVVVLIIKYVNYQTMTNPQGLLQHQWKPCSRVCSICSTT